MIKVAMIADLPESGAPIDGGVQAVTSYLVDALTQFSEVELHVVTFRHGIGSVPPVHESGYVRHWLPFGKFGTATGFLRDQALLNSCLAEIRPDVVHSQGGGHHGILAKRCGYPAVVTIHGILTAEAAFLPGRSQRLRTRLQGWFANRNCIRRGTHTILISPYVAEHYGDTLSGKRYLIPNPVHARFFDVTPLESPGRVLFAGRLYALKGIKDLVHAVSRTAKQHDTRVVLAGSLADSQYVHELRTLAHQLEVADRMELPGSLDMDELLEELSRCACLVLPSYQETAPMVIQEAMASGVPVIATDVGGVRYQVDDGSSGYVVAPGDIEALTQRLDTLLSDQGVRARFAAAGKARAEREYRAEIVARKTLDVYLDMIR